MEDVVKIKSGRRGQQKIFSLGEPELRAASAESCYMWNVRGGRAGFVCRAAIWRFHFLFSFFKLSGRLCAVGIGRKRVCWHAAAALWGVSALKRKRKKTLIKNKLKNAASVCAALCEAELKTEAAAGDQKRNDLLLKGTHKKEEDESEQNERKTNKKHVRNEKTNIMKQTRLGSLKKCSGEFRRPLVEGGGTTSQMYQFYLDEEGLRGRRKRKGWFFFSFFYCFICHSTKNVHGNYKQTSQ